MRAGFSRTGLRAGAAATALAALAGAAVFAVSTSAASSGLAGKHVFVVSCAPSDPYCATYNSQLEKDLGAKGIKVSLVTNPKNSAEEEQELTEAVSQHPDVIVNLPTDSVAVAEGYAKAAAQHIPVIATVNPVSSAAMKYAKSEVYDNNQAMGQAAAENIQAGLKAIGATHANVISITGNAASSTTTQRENAFKAQLAKTPQFKLVAVQDGNWDPVQTQKVASTLFASWQSKGGIQAAYGMSGLQATGIVRAAQLSGITIGLKKKGVIISGSNCGPASIQAIKSGTMYGDASETPSGDVNAVVPYVIKLLSGQSIPKVVLVPAVPITAANVKQWTAACSY